MSGGTFDAFDLRPALGRLLAEDDDREARGEPLAVLSHDYWTARFGRDPRVLGRTMRIGDELVEIVGVIAPGFTGTEPGAPTDIFMPSRMHPGVQRADWSWLRIFALVEPRASVEALQAELDVAVRGFRRALAARFVGRPAEAIDRFLNVRLALQPAPTGVSTRQAEYRRALGALGGVVGLVLLLACANVATLLTAHGASRAREMALRVSIGAGRARLVQLVIVEAS